MQPVGRLRIPTPDLFEDSKHRPARPTEIPTAYLRQDYLRLLPGKEAWHEGYRSRTSKGEGEDGHVSWRDHYGLHVAFLLLRNHAESSVGRTSPSTRLITFPDPANAAVSRLGHSGRIAFLWISLTLIFSVTSSTVPRSHK